MLDYFFHTPKKNIKLSMVILVKNEEDIIEKNIKFHSKMGNQYKRWAVIYEKGKLEKVIII